jgi:hypothetical protein
MIKSGIKSGIKSMVTLKQSDTDILEKTLLRTDNMNIHIEKRIIRDVKINVWMPTCNMIFDRIFIPILTESRLTIVRTYDVRLKLK